MCVMGHGVRPAGALAGVWLGEVRCFARLTPRRGNGTGSAGVLRSGGPSARPVGSWGWSGGGGGVAVGWVGAGRMVCARGADRARGVSAPDPPRSWLVRAVRSVRRGTRVVSGGGSGRTSGGPCRATTDRRGGSVSVGSLGDGATMGASIVNGGRGIARPAGSAAPGLRAPPPSTPGPASRPWTSCP